jgi:hypothetical protein
VCLLFIECDVITVWEICGSGKRCQAEVEFLSLCLVIESLYCVIGRKRLPLDACDVIMVLRLLLAVAFLACILAQNDG